MEPLKLEKRTLLGKKAKRLYKQNGLIPGVFYNSNKESRTVEITQGEVERLLQHATTSTVVAVDYEGKAYKALVKEVDVDPIKDQIRHISLFEIDPKAEMTYEIPIEIIGISPAVKNNLGVLVLPTKSLEVRCKLEDLIDVIEVDISGLEHPGQTIMVSDLKLPESFKLPNEEAANRAIASITQLQKLVETEEEVPVAEGEEGEEVVEGEEVETEE